MLPDHQATAAGAAGAAGGVLLQGASIKTDHTFSAAAGPRSGN